MTETPNHRASRWAPPQSVWKDSIKSFLLRSASHASTLGHRLLGVREQGHLGILMYHRIAPHIPGVAAPTINVPPERFRAQLEGLLLRGYEFWPLRKVLDHCRDGAETPERVIVLTFDDAFRSVYAHAWPVLRELGVPATVFVSTAYLDHPAPMPFDHWGLANRTLVPTDSFLAMTRQQCRELLDSGLIDLGAHTHTHEDFRNRPTEFLRDLRQSVEFLADEFGVTDPTFAFPYGTPRKGFVSEDLVEAAKQAGVQCGLTTQACTVDPQADPFQWGRFNVFPWDSPATLSAKIDGCYSWAPAQRDRLTSLIHRLNPFQTTNADATTTSDGSNTPSGPRLAFSPDPSLPNATQRDTISVIIPTYNRAEWLVEALGSLTRQVTDDCFDYEIIVIDNASTDDTREVVAQLASRTETAITYLHQTEPGDAPTRNAGVRYSQSRWLAFFDDDQLAEPDWLKELYAAAVETGAPVIGGPVHINLPQERLQQLGPLCRRALREISYYATLHPYVNKDLPGTGNALVARSAFAELGLFDESMTSGGSDSDFFLRAREAGLQLWYTPTAVIRHRISENRMTPEYLRWDALSGGAGHAAHFDLLKKGKAALFALCGVRLLHSVLVNLPLYLWARLRGDSGDALGRRTLIWRTEGYVRKTLAVMAPNWFPQREFFDSLEFRKGRDVGVAGAEETTQQGSIGDAEAGEKSDSEAVGAV